EGELRFKQALFDPEGVIVYERTGPVEPLKNEILSGPEGGSVVFPAWSPDGAIIAYRVTQPARSGGIYVVPAGGGKPQRAVGESGTTDPLAWGPHSKRIAFANASKGNMDIYIVDIFSGTVERVTTDGGSDTSPSWASDGREIVFCSDRGGTADIWVKDLETGKLDRISSGGGNTYPAVSPGGRRIAWIREGRGLVILDRDTGRQSVIETPREVSFVPAWSPDGRVLAVTARDWGGADVYLTAADGSSALLLTKSDSGEGMPSWAPGGDRMAIVSNEEGDYRLRVLDGVAAFTERVLHPPEILTFPPPE
ncbi:MAG: hypothetical protein P8181_08900, partial [bacterium]